MARKKVDGDTLERFPLRIVGDEEDVPRMLMAAGKGCGGELAMIVRPREGTSLITHQAKQQTARVWRGTNGHAPVHPNDTHLGKEIPAEAAVVELRAFKARPAAPGPAVLKGAWKGALQCDNDVLSMTLERKVASYGVLRLSTTPDGRWSVSFERAARWFAEGKQVWETRIGLAEAIQAGMGLVTGLVGEACTARDTQRRNAVDPAYADLHPPRPPKDVKDPTEKFKPKDPAAEKPKGKGGRVAGGKKTASGQVPTLDSIPAPEVPSCPISVGRIASAVGSEADALGNLAQSLWGSTEAPELVGRAGKLIRHAESLVRSPLCTGKEQQSAMEDLRRAGEAYKQAADSLERGDNAGVVTTLRRVAERVSLAAARAAKSCAAGQQQLLGAPGPGAATQPASRWVYGDRVTWQGQTWIVRGVSVRGNVEIAREGSDLTDEVDAAELRRAPAETRPTVPMQPVWPPAAPPMMVPTTEKPKRGRKPKAAEVDPAKDKLLVDAFADAIKQAAASMGGGA